MPPSTCYMCDATSTSIEHVPPRCLFPEQRDLPPDADLRRQLITVPSCRVHNTERSQDDEYLLYALVMSLPNNQTAADHFSTKILRAIARRPTVIKMFTRTQLRVTIENSETGEVQETLALQVDHSRLGQALEKIGRALYFHHFGTPYAGTVSPYPHFLLAITEENARELNAPLESMAAAAEEVVLNTPRHGENPAVFCYQFVKSQGPVSTIMLLRFYEGSKVTLLFRDDVFQETPSN